MDRDRQSQIVSGLIIIGIGFVFLFHTMGLVIDINWRHLLDFWPLILVFIGLNILLKKTVIWWVVPLLMVLSVIFLLVTDYNLPGRYSYFNGYEYSSEKSSGVYRAEKDFTDEINRFKVNLAFGAGQLDIGSVKDNSNLYEAKLKHYYSRPIVDYSYARANKTATLSLEGQKRYKGLDFKEVDDWNLYLSPDVLLDIELNIGAGEFNLNLDKLQIDSLVVNTGASDLEIDLGLNTDTVELNSGAANVKLNLPKEAGVEIRSTGVISSNNFQKEGMIKTGGNIYYTKGYEESEKKIRIVINASASNIDVDFN